MGSPSGPQHLSQAISELIAVRGLARTRGNDQLAQVWAEVAGEKIELKTKVIAVKRGVLEIGVANAPLLSELASFHKQSLLSSLQSKYPNLKIRDLKFRLKGEISE